MLLVLILVVVASRAVQEQQAEVPEGDEILAVEIQGIPDEPPVQGGFPPAVPETEIEPVTSEIPSSRPIDGFMDDEDCSSSPWVCLTVAQLLVDDALQILSGLSQSRSSSDTSSSSFFVRILFRILEILKSMSFLQYSSQEEPLTTHNEKYDTLEKAMDLLTQSAEKQNSDALYLLGELNFVFLFCDHIKCSTEITRKRIIANRSNGSRSWLRRMEIVLLSIYLDLCMQRA